MPLPPMLHPVLLHRSTVETDEGDKITSRIESKREEMKHNESWNLIYKSGGRACQQCVKRFLFSGRSGSGVNEEQTAFQE